MPATRVPQAPHVSFDTEADATRILDSQLPEVTILQAEKRALVKSLLQSALDEPCLSEAEMPQRAVSLDQARILHAQYAAYPPNVLRQMETKYASQKYMAMRAQSIAQYLQLLEKPESEPQPSHVSLTQEAIHFLEQNQESMTFWQFFETPHFVRNGEKEAISLSDMCDDIRTFGSQVSVCFDADISLLPPKIQSFFRIARRKLYHAGIKKEIEHLRDQQQTHLYKGVRDYGATDPSEHYGLFAEQVFERAFRLFLRHDTEFQEYDISLRKASLLEDQKGKMDLILTLKHKEYGFRVDQELQLTVNQNPEILAGKKGQLAIVKKGSRHDVELIALAKNSIGSSFALWRSLGFPTGALISLLSVSDMELLTQTFRDILSKASQKLPISHQTANGPSSTT